MLANLQEFIKQHSELTEEDFMILASKLQPASFDKKTRVVDIGEVANNFYFVLTGIARRYFFRGKQEVITHIIKEGGIMGSVISFLTGEPSRYILETIEPVTALSMSKPELEALFSSHQKWEKFGRKLLTSYFLQTEYHNLDNIRYSTKERFVNFMKQNPDLVLRVPQKYLASYLEIQPETFSRLKHLMVKEK